MYELLIAEHVSAWTSRAEVRSHLDESLDELGAELLALSVGRTPEDAQRETWGDDPANEQGIQAMAAIAAQFSG